MRVELRGLVGAWFFIVVCAGCVSSAGSTSSSSSGGSTASAGTGGMTTGTGGSGGVGVTGTTTGATSSTKASATATSSSGGGCAHDVCQQGLPLTPGCSSCAAKVCMNDAFCCGGMNGTWDQNCVSEASALCGAGCAGACGPDTCPFGCCDATGLCKQDGCELYGVACGGDVIPNGHTCESCSSGKCETCDGSGCKVCVPNCQGKPCGAPDGCGSRCDGTCGGGEFCSIALGQCTNVCDTNSCPNGCCDQNNTCQPGVTDASCGWLGSSCMACAANGPKCVPIPTAPIDPQGLPSAPQGGKCQACDSTTCPLGCCSADGHCVTTEHDSACGRHGAACADCTTQGSICNGYTCSDCVPQCAGKACGAPDGCGAVCTGSCPTGEFCVVNSAATPNGCAACDATTCPTGCCTADGQCLAGYDRKACGSGGQTCADCGAQACNESFTMQGTFVSSCGACGQNCAQVPPGTCVDDGCGALCPGAGCPGPSPGTCEIGSGGHAMCQPQGFCDPLQCAGCCDYSTGGFGGTCVTGNLPSKCGSHAVQCVDCVSLGETCDTATDKCAGCTPTQCTGKSYPTCGQPDGCGGVCTGAEGGTCAPGAACDATGKCACTNPSQAICPVGNTTSCIDVSSDPMNCGHCGMQCPSGVACSAGVCQCPQPNAHFCEAFGTAGVCTNLATDSKHCGNCSTSCPGTPCNDGVCGSCPAGDTACNGTCANLMTDAANCGGCGNVCPAGVACVNGQCPCGGGKFGCGGTCTDLMTDSQHCGSCTKSCPTGVSCQAGQCMCPGGATLCQGTCTNTTVDPQNCGMCGHPCLPGQNCSGSQCL